MPSPSRPSHPSAPSHASPLSSSATKPHSVPRPLVSALTGTTSGSATPSTSYGSFPPADDLTAAQGAKNEVERLLRAKLGASIGGKGERGQRRWTRSRERLVQSGSEDVYDSDASLEGGRKDGEQFAEDGRVYRTDTDEETDEDERGAIHWDEGAPLRRRKSASGEDDGWRDVPATQPRDQSERRSGANGSTRQPEEDKQWGVVKMEIMARTWGRKGLFTIYAGLYLISALMSLEGNTTPTIEPYFLSLLGEHSMLSSVVIVMSIAYAVGKPPMTKILDVFGRAEGICFAAALYSVGYLITAAATDVKVYIVARALSALGGQGVQLAQQIIVADTTTLSNRGLITSTVSLPWLLTTWIGPPLGAFFQRKGPIGYRAAYAVFGILLPLVACLLFCTLYLEWRKIRRKALAEGRKPSTKDLGFGVTTRRHRTLSSSAYSITGSPARPKPPHPPAALSHLSPPSHDFADNLDLESASAPGSSRPLTAREHREACAAADAANELTKRKRWNMTPWSKAVELWHDLDVLGLVALTVGCVLFLLPFTLATKRPESWGDGLIWLLIFSGALILVFFGYYELHHASIPLLPPRLLKNRTIVGGSAMGFFHFASQFCYESFFTSFLQVARGHSPQDASYISQSYIFAACVAALLAGYLAKITNRYKWIGIAGVLIHAVGVWLMMRSRNLDGSTFELVLSQLIGGVGGGFTTIAVQTGCQSVVGHQDVAIATAIFLTITQVGGAVGGSIAGAVWSTSLPRRLVYHLPSSEQSHIPSIIASLPYALSFPSGSVTRIAINKAYVDVQKILNGLAMAMLVPGLLSMCAMKDVNLGKDDQGGEGVVVLGRASFLACEDELTSSETSSLLGGSPE
ncbi:hypothetical protein JCM10296v2_004867 [Rhodotorula toruloides]